MKRFLLLSLFLAIVSCEQSPEGNPEEIESKKMKVSVITEAASEINLTSAKLTATVSITNPAEDAEAIAYFYYSAEDKEVKAVKQNGIRVPVGTITMEDSSFETTINNLSPSTLYYYFAELAIDDQVFYGQINSFTTAEKPKELSVTGTTYDITEFTAKISGYANLTPDLGEVTMGILYSLDENPTLDNSTELISKEIDDNNMYIVQATGLKYNTTYYYKSFVKYGGVYRSGEVKSFTTKDFSATVTTEEATNIAVLGATLNGSVSVESQDDIPNNLGFLYGTKDDIEYLKTSGRSVRATSSIDGSFYARPSLSQNVTYYYVAFAKLLDKEYYGEVKSFTTSTIEAATTIITTDATDVGTISAIVGGNLTVEYSTELLPPYTTWILYSDTATNLESLQKSGNKIIYSTYFSGGPFSQRLQSLKDATTYYYVACAEVRSKTVYGEVKSFTTEEIKVNIETIEASNVEISSATLRGVLTVENKETLSKNAWFLYSASKSSLEDLKTSGNKMSAVIDTDGSFSCTLTSLNSSTAYYYISCAKVHNKEYYGEVKSFKTADISASVTTSDATSIYSQSATIKGRLEVDKGKDLSKSVGFLYSNSACTQDDLISTGIELSSSLTSNGSFSYTFPPDKLNVMTTYYYVACARIHDREYYGEVKSFTTKDYTYVAYAIDLGLSCKWSSYNLGAERQTERGKPFHKGEDIVNAKLGGNWAMPGNGEWQELINNCGWYWTEMNDGVCGWKVVSPITKEFIFLPATSNNGVGYYWSYNYPSYLYFSTGYRGVSNNAQDSDIMYVRPVTN